MFSVLGGTEARRLPGASQFPWKQLGIALLAVTLIASVAVLMFNLLSSAPAQPVQTKGVSIGPASTVSSTTLESATIGAMESLQGIPTPAQPIITEWPRIAPEWTYTLVVPPMPKGKGIYDGRASGTIWITPGSRGTADYEERRAIATRIVPSITPRDGVGLSIVQNPDNPRVFLGAVHVIRDVQTRAELVARGKFGKEAELKAQERQEIHLGVSMDNQETWVILGLPLGGANNLIDGINAIDNVGVIGTSPLHLAIRPSSSWGYWETDVSP
ncbi:MAG: hypothetical protein A3C82_00885 [Candidatus Wildermuthbacteria bacterium RIFCSPHIGHO2_02_FULL_47_12]|uniref:Uncharacterized protein n=1 Tax=Candidatus Wildermuthbacteria bacterium RIFCSPHIGHO2_02_FULL_47_12 TaxID=1802451 RepID=A0A1G2R3Q4_9BACT|nr:MAG: hypothetical protein A3C82_00885 [Candidatus Wildermuthbacteria bacterium RIFCSPHIGHO2_02_FULL_47_12]